MDISIGQLNHSSVQITTPNLPVAWAHNTQVNMSYLYTVMPRPYLAVPTSYIKQPGKLGSPQGTAPVFVPNMCIHAGVGQVLDIGAGTGRSSIMVLKVRPQATLVALDLFGESFNQHFGPGQSPQQRLLANLQAAGVERRAAIVTADMRKLPFEPATFDAIISAYVFEHLNGEGIQQSLAEAVRVAKPGGDFLLMLVAKEPWSQ